MLHKYIGGTFMKFHKYTRKTLKVFLLLILPIVLLMTAESHIQSTKADDTEVVVTPKFTPNKEPKKFLGIWMSSGYSLQPNPDYYTVVDSSVTIRNNAVRSIWKVLTGAFDGVHYRWWQSTKNWTKVSEKNNGYKKNFTVTPSEVGTTWYQLDTQYYTLLTPLFKTHIYSQVTAVHALEAPVNAISLEVTVDDKYLYNTSDELSNTTYAHAVPTPSNATGTITWSMSDTTLATIDEDGEITANNQGKSGTVEAIATMTNNDGSIIQGRTPVEIGGGLDDQTVHSGETANFVLKGNTGGDSDDDDSGSITIDWYKYDPITNAKTKVASGTDTDYTTPKTTYADNGTLYQAVLTLKSGKVTKTITTNKALLTVIPSGDPDLEITNKLVNKTFTAENNTDTKLYQTINNDNIVYTDTIQNKSTEGILKDGYYVLPLHAGTSVNSVKINDQTLTSDKYTLVSNDTDQTDDLVIPLGTLITQASVDITVDTTVKNITLKETLSTTPYAYGTNNDGNIYRQDGSNEQINYITGNINAKIQDIDYGNISGYSKNTLKYRNDALNSPNNIVDVDDDRRDKNSLKVFISQDSDFAHESLNSVLPATLRYYENGSYQTVTNNKVQISAADLGQELSSIAWNKEDGLLLHINDDHPVAGKYSTTLTWYFENSI